MRAKKSFVPSDKTLRFGRKNGTKEGLIQKEMCDGLMALFCQKSH